MPWYFCTFAGMILLTVYDSNQVVFSGQRVVASWAARPFCRKRGKKPKRCTISSIDQRRPNALGSKCFLLLWNRGNKQIFASLLKFLLKHAACVLQELIFNGLFGDEGSARICPLNSREDLKEGVEQMELMEPMQLGDGRKDWRHRHQLSKNSTLYLTRGNAQACRTRYNLLSCGCINGALRKRANTRIKVLWLAFARK